MCAPRVTRHTSNISSCEKKNFFSFSVAVKNSIKVGPLVFLLQIFVITENSMKRPVFSNHSSKENFRVVSDRIFATLEPTVGYFQ